MRSNNNTALKYAFQFKECKSSSKKIGMWERHWHKPGRKGDLSPKWILPSSWKISIHEQE